jgi:predicted DNA-binding transcriptional regulator AlpA
MNKDLIRISEFAKIAGMTVGTCYVYHAKSLYKFPPADVTVGVVCFWKRSKATAWSNRRKARARR